MSTSLPASGVGSHCGIEALKERGITDVVFWPGVCESSSFLTSKPRRLRFHVLLVIEEGYKAVEAAHLYLTGQEVPKFVEIQQVMVTKG
jgi:ribose transport system substrate-binding protein